MNIGNHHPETVSTLVSLLEKATGTKAMVEYLPMQPGDVKATFADITTINDYSGFRPQTDLETGLKMFVDWYVKYFIKDLT